MCLKEKYNNFQEAKIFQKLEYLKNTVMDMRRSDENQKAYESLLINMVRDLQRKLTPDDYHAAKEYLQTPELP